MPAPKATSHGFGGGGGAGGALNLRSAASAGAASATAATTDKINLFIWCPFQINATPAPIVSKAFATVFPPQPHPLRFKRELTTRHKTGEGKDSGNCRIFEQIKGLGV